MPDSPYPVYRPQVPIPGGIPPGDYVYGGGGATPPPAVPVPMPGPAAPTPVPPPPSAAPPAAAANAPRRLSDAEKQAILAMLKRGPGWTVSDFATPNTRLGTDPKTGLGSINIPTDDYSVQLIGPTGEPTGAKIMAGPAGPDGTPTWALSDTPDAAPKPPSASASTVPAKDGSVWEKDANGEWKNTGIPTQPSNPDVDRSLALKAQGDQELIDARRANQQAGKGYLTDDELRNHDEALRRIGVSEDQIKIDRDKFALQKQNDDAKRQPEIDEIKARTVGLGASADLARAQASNLGITGDINQRKAGPEISEIEARTAASNATTAKARQDMTIAAAPGTISNVGTGPNIYSSDPLTGALSTQLNANYQPKTQAEIAARVGQLQTLAVAKKQELMGKVSATYSPDQALKDWTSWWDSNVESQKQALAAAQDEAQFARTKDEAAMRTQAFTSASAAGTLANTAMNDQAARTVGPGAREASAALLGGATRLTPEMAASQFYKAPNQADAAHNAVMEALKYISPGAAAANGMPTPDYSRVDIQGGLNRMNYAPQFGGPPPGGPPMGGPPPAGPAPVASPPPPPPVVDPNAWWQALRGRQAVDVAEQQRQAQVAGSPDQWAQWIPNYVPG